MRRASMPYDGRDVTGEVNPRTSPAASASNPIRANTSYWANCGGFILNPERRDVGHVVE